MSAQKKKKGKDGPGDIGGPAKKKDGNANNWEAESVFGDEPTNIESADIVETLEAQLDTARNQVRRITGEFANFRKRRLARGSGHTRGETAAIVSNDLYTAQPRRNPRIADDPHTGGEIGNAGVRHPRQILECEPALHGRDS